MGVKVFTIATISMKEDEEELKAEYDVDGAYVPRIYFLGRFVLWACL